MDFRVLIVRHTKQSFQIASKEAEKAPWSREIGVEQFQQRVNGMEQWLNIHPDASFEIWGCCFPPAKGALPPW